jgi:hypothetical protein
MGIYTIKNINAGAYHDPQAEPAGERLPEAQRISGLQLCERSFGARSL